jgi:uncharacterized protein YkwD
MRATAPNARHLTRSDPRSRVGTVLAALGLTLALGLGGALAPAAPAAASEADTIHALVNEARWSNGLAGLVRNSALDQVAAAWAAEMAAAGTMSHNPSVGGQIPGGWISWGENVANGHPNGAVMHAAWMDSPGHRANVLGDFTDLGVAFLAAGGTTWGVEVFATYPGSGGAPPPAPAPADPPDDPAAPEPAPEPSATSDPTPSPSSSPRASERQTPGPRPSPTPSGTAIPAGAPGDPTLLAAGLLIVTVAIAAGAVAVGRFRRARRHPRHAAPQVAASREGQPPGAPERDSPLG